MNCGSEIDESQSFCDPTCEEQYLGVGENEEEEDDDYD